MNKKIHKWLSIAVVVQLLIWLSTGLYFNIMDHQQASGNAKRIKIETTSTFADFTFFPITNLPVENVEAIDIVWLQDHPFYLVSFQNVAHGYQKQHRRLFNAVSGKSYYIDGEVALSIAMSSYQGHANVLSTQRLLPPIAELIKEENNVWQIKLDDKANTHIYVSESSGKVIAHVNDDRRLKDLMLKLHFMDYANQGSFNNPQMIVFALLSLILTLTGIIWAIPLFKQFLQLTPWRQQYKTIPVMMRHSNQKVSYQLNKNKTVIEGLSDVGIELPSTCGGGGTCGCCKFMTSNMVPTNIAEQVLLTPKQQALGIRLACQHQVNEVNEIECMHDN